MARLKTVVLVCLVTTSIILSVLLMSGRPGPSQAHREEVWFGPTPALHEISLPGRMYIINFQQEAHLVQTFSRMYSDLIMAFAQTQYGEEGGDLWTPGEYPTDSYPPGVLLRYDYQITRGLLASWLAMFNEADFPFAAIDCIFFPLDRGPVQFINTSSREVWQLQASLTWDVVERALSEPRDILDYTWTEMKSGENYTVAPGIYQLTKPEAMVVPGWVSEEISHDAVIRSFYLEPSVIQEPDGTEIYTDGLQALRIFPSGALEYTIGRAQGSSVPRQAGSLKTALNFISSHGGWPGNMLPAFIGVTSQERVRLEFSVFGFGLPIIGDAGIAVELEGSSVNHLSRKIIAVSSDRDIEYIEIKPLSTHLVASESQAAQFFVKVDQEITDLALAYYFYQDHVIPVWRVWIGNQIISVGAADGRIINVRSPSGGD